MKSTKATGTDTYCYTRAEMVRMLSYCLESTARQWLHPILLALATTGMRIGELSGLRWPDIDFQSNLIHVRDERASRRKVIKGRIRTTKGKESRAIPLNKDLKAEFVRLRIAKHSDGFVFHGPKGARIRPKKFLLIFKRRVRDKLKDEFPVPEDDIGFGDGTIHSFRHFFVSEAFRRRFSPGEIQEWIGHKSSEVTRIYKHLRPGKSHRQMQMLNFFDDDTVSSDD